MEKYKAGYKGVNESLTEGKDNALGSVEDYLKKMEAAKSDAEVEKIVAKAKGNPNADTAYKKYLETKKGKKIALDESLFEDFEEEHVGKSVKKDPVLKKKPSAKTSIKEAVAVKVDVRDYKPWSGATIAYSRIQEEGKLDYLFQLLEEIYPDGIDAQALNDLLWFDREWLYQILGIKDENGEPEEGDEE